MGTAGGGGIAPVLACTTLFVCYSPRALQRYGSSSETLLYRARIRPVWRNLNDRGVIFVRFPSPDSNKRKEKNQDSEAGAGQKCSVSGLLPHSKQKCGRFPPICGGNLFGCDSQCPVDPPHSPPGSSRTHSSLLSADDILQGESHSAGERGFQGNGKVCCLAAAEIAGAAPPPPLPPAITDPLPPSVSQPGIHCSLLARALVERGKAREWEAEGERGSLLWLIVFRTFLSL